MYCMPNGQTHIARRGDIVVWEEIVNAQRSQWAHPYCPGSSESSSGEIGAVTTLPQRRTFCIFKHRLPRNPTKYGLIGHQQIDLEPNYQMSKYYQWLSFVNVVFIKAKRNSYFGPLTSFSCKLISFRTFLWLKQRNLSIRRLQNSTNYVHKAGDSTNTNESERKSIWFSKTINVFKICVSSKVTFCLTNCPLAPNSTTTTLPSHVVAKLKYKNTDEASRNTIIKKQIQHMKYRQQLVYGRKKVQSWLGLVASGPMEWGKRGKGWPEKATVRWSQLNVGGFFSWYESLHHSMWRR